MQPMRDSPEDMGIFPVSFFKKRLIVGHEIFCQLISSSNLMLPLH